MTATAAGAPDTEETSRAASGGSRLENCMTDLATGILDEAGRRQAVFVGKAYEGGMSAVLGKNGKDRHDLLIPRDPSLMRYCSCYPL